MELFVFSMFFILFSVVGCIIYLIYWPIKLHLFKKGILSRKLSKRINYIYIVILFMCICSATYVGLYPDDDFYADEFKTVTLRDLPESAEFISKSADYPDIHGDYCSHSEIRLSTKDYRKLLWELYRDDRISKPGHKVLENQFMTDFHPTHNSKHIFIRQIENQEDHFLKIEFDKDLKRVYIDVCIS